MKNKGISSKFIMLQTLNIIELKNFSHDKKSPYENYFKANRNFRLNGFAIT